VSDEMAEALASVVGQDEGAVGVEDAGQAPESLNADQGGQAEAQATDATTEGQFDPNNLEQLTERERQVRAYWQTSFNKWVEDAKSKYADDARDAEMFRTLNKKPELRQEYLRSMGWVEQPSPGVQQAGVAQTAPSPVDDVPPPDPDSDTYQQDLERYVSSRIERAVTPHVQKLETALQTQQQREGQREWSEFVSRYPDAETLVEDMRVVAQQGRASNLKDAYLLAKIDRTMAQRRAPAPNLNQQQAQPQVTPPPQSTPVATGGAQRIAGDNNRGYQNSYDALQEQLAEDPELRKAFEAL